MWESGAPCKELPPALPTTDKLELTMEVEHNLQTNVVRNPKETN